MRIKMHGLTQIKERINTDKIRENPCIKSVRIRVKRSG